MSNYQNQTNQEKEKAVEPKSYHLLSFISEGDVTVRDDQYDFFWILDTIKHSRKKGVRFRLIDSGCLTSSQLDWLAKAGADIYTTNEVRPNPLELQFLSKIAQRSNSIVAYFYQDEIEDGVGEERETRSFYNLINLAASGVYLHFSNKQGKRDLSKLSLLAATCCQGGSWLIYYHHGPLEPALDELAASGAWIHLSGKSLREQEETSLLLNIIKSAKSAGANIVFHLEKEMNFGLVQDLIKEGACVLFTSFIPDYKSPFYPLAREARRKKLNFRSFYLYPHFML